MGFKSLLLVTGFCLGIVVLVGGNGAVPAGQIGYQENPQSCGECHLIKPYVESWKNSDFLDHKHGKCGIGCSECHPLTREQERRHVAVFDKKTYKSPLEEREYGNDLCFRCHGSYSDIIERTKDYKSKGLPRNPHQSHYEEMDCNLCHKAHRISIDYCSQCHQPGVNKPGWKTI